MRLGVCYYPEQWPEAWWAEDARHMRDMGISTVRIGEFAWSRIEPQAGVFQWAWLDRAVEALARAGLKIIMGTPTATPPKWLVDLHPDILAVDANGAPRRFGARRHYCFSSETYAGETARIVRAVAERYGTHPAVIAWQTDNEYGCHESVISYSHNAQTAFRIWLAQKYCDIAALNSAWGTVFWSQEYGDFAEVDLPFQTVTEPNPAHVLDFKRFSSDKVVVYNRLQSDILREKSPGRDIVHNFMGFVTSFDHYDVSKDLDVATWDSYPLGFLEEFWFSTDEKARYRQQGHPDIAAFHHDLYRGCANGRWWVMEQQPGPVNWAGYNPAPLPGMVRLWTWEAFAHGAELVSYFRWRQVPFAQEQMHAGLLRPDRVEDTGGIEARAVASELNLVAGHATTPAPVALIFSYEAQWLIDTQRHGKSFNYIRLVYDYYSALRQCGVDVDIVSPEADLNGYRLIVVPSLPILTDALVEKLKNCTAKILIGPRTGSKTSDYQIPATLAPGKLQTIMPLKIVRVESLRPGTKITGDMSGYPMSAEHWFEQIESDLIPIAKSADGSGMIYEHGPVRYVSCWLDKSSLAQLVQDTLQHAGLTARVLPDDLRLRQLGDIQFAFNYGTTTLQLDAHLDISPTAHFYLGNTELPPAGVAAWR
jgi:beta-galactosidase